MKTSNGGPAFPVLNAMDRNGNPTIDTSLGMTLRDYFATAALTSMGYTHTYYGKNAEALKDAAESAYRAADAMLAAREAK